ncbi:malate synthase A [Cytophagales bacterium LB-30]|uniref:Malate synthase n=1 Tax=Shiella aurantiaca TaxID=3058365 RepID=A0ABT8F8R2_9BACT|nr:malate synthase A [Shiella aurantiaca]MDN4166870.1 malate synthase A [Shiella aurantiaca]
MSSVVLTEHPLQVEGGIPPHLETILSAEALAFLAHLHVRFQEKRLALLQRRKEKQKDWDAGKLPGFLEETRSIRESDWKITSLPDALQDRRVEITGPVDAKMLINALNSGAKVFMADFEDATSPIWPEIIEGQANIKEAVRGNLQFVSDTGKKYTLHAQVAVLKVRPRGWHLSEKHLRYEGEALSASLVDFGLFMFHNAAYLQQQERGPYVYLPKLENHLEARLWNEVFVEAQAYLGIPQGSVKATVLIETILAAFEMDEIIFELRQHMAGLNAGRWDYIFSSIKKFREQEAFILPDRQHISMEVPFMKAYAELLVQTCHKRGAHAIGGMSAFIPSADTAINEVAFEKVRKDKLREASQGYDGTWVAHPKLVPVAIEVFNEKLGDRSHQKHISRSELQVQASDLLNLATTPGQITEEGLRQNVRIALLYLESWLKGTGAAALFNLMEDAATAEISRAQIWQWIRHKALLADGRQVSVDLYHHIKQEEMQTLLINRKSKMESSKHIKLAEAVLDELVLDTEFAEFLTLNAYLLLP